MNQVVKTILYSIILIITNFKIFSQGVILESKDDLISNGAEIYDQSDFGLKLGFLQEKIPENYSMRKYAPPPRRQKGGTCVGFSTAYSTLSTIYNVAFDISDDMLKYATSFDPYFVYSLIKEEEDFSCQQGLFMSDALNLLKKVGVKKFSMPPYFQCESKLDPTKIDIIKEYSKNYKIDNWSYIASDNPRYIDIIKENISNGIPVICTIPIFGSFEFGIENNGLWKPLYGLESNVGYHAMTIMGYDDNKFNGSFEILNSWGKDFGDNGYVWIKYDDYKKFAYSSFFIIPNENIYSDLNPLILGDEFVRYKTNHIFEGQFVNNNSNKKVFDENSKFNGFGQYIWSNKNVYSGYWINGKRHGTALFFRNKDKKIAYMKYDNGNFIDPTSLGFSSYEDEEIIQLKEYIKYFDSSIELEALTQEPDFETGLLNKKIIN